MLNFKVNCSTIICVHVHVIHAGTYVCVHICNDTREKFFVTYNFKSAKYTRRFGFELFACQLSIPLTSLDLCMVNLSFSDNKT